MTTMASSMPCLKSACLKAAKLWCCALLFFAAGVAWTQGLTEISQFRVEHADADVLISAQVNFELPVAVEEAMLKGIPLFFVYEATLVRQRWYWYDKRVAAVERHLRLSYQPLTRQWRLNVSTISEQDGGVSLNQSFESLTQALVIVKRLSGWKLTDASQLEVGRKYNVHLDFRLDLSQLPRPFQIGMLGQSDWDIAAAASAPFALEP